MSVFLGNLFPGLSSHADVEPHLEGVGPLRRLCATAKSESKAKRAVAGPAAKKHAVARLAPKKRVAARRTRTTKLAAARSVLTKKRAAAGPAAKRAAAGPPPPKRAVARPATKRAAARPAAKRAGRTNAGCVDQCRKIQIITKPVCLRAPRTTLTVGSACSGLDTEMWALRKLGFATIHKFSCDNEPAVQRFVSINHSPELFVSDVKSAQFASLPSVDLFVAGPPCQPFSAAGHGMGTFDDRGRGTIVWHIINWIARAQPKVFVLENVRGLLTHHPGTLLSILRALCDIKDTKNVKVYHVSWKELNTEDFGVPQARQGLGGPI